MFRHRITFKVSACTLWSSRYASNDDQLLKKLVCALFRVTTRMNRTTFGTTILNVWTPSTRWNLSLTKPGNRSWL